MSQFKVGIARFLGTNCDQDTWDAVSLVGFSSSWLWQEDHFDWKDYQFIVIPGGFSYGDYLRSGALASRSPVMNSILEAYKHGVPILGICNGFQILCEVGLLPGVLLKNEGQLFVDKWQKIRVVHSNLKFNGHLKNGEEISIPIAHGDGRFFVDNESLQKMYDKDQIWFKYIDNPNGSTDDIAGVFSENKKVAGLMPHPERAVQKWMGSDQGLSLLKYWNN